MKDSTFEQKLDQIDAILAVMDDTETPLWMGKMMEEKIPDAGLVVEKGAGHFAYLEQNQRFLRIVKNFLLEGRA